MSYGYGPDPRDDRYGPPRGPQGPGGYGPRPSYVPVIPLRGRPGLHRFAVAFFFPFSLFSAVGREFVKCWIQTPLGKSWISVYLAAQVIGLLGVFVPVDVLSVLLFPLSIAGWVLVGMLTSRRGDVLVGPRYMGPQQYGYGYGPGPDPRYDNRDPRYDAPRYDDRYGAPRDPRYDAPRYDRDPRYDAPRYDDRDPRADYRDRDPRYDNRDPRYDDRDPHYDAPRDSAPRFEEF